MTPDNLQPLRDAVTNAENEASSATAAANADPANLEKQAAAEAANQKLANAKKVLTDAESGKATTVTRTFIASDDSTPEIEQHKIRISFLGIYLLLAILGSVYVLGGLMVAETDKDRVDRILALRCCCKGVACPSPTPSGTPDQSAPATPTPTPTSTSTPTQSPSPSPTSPPANTSTNARPGAETNMNTNAGKVAASPTPSENKSPDVTIPAEVYLRIWGVTDDVWSADGYVFLVVFFSGMLGGGIRGIYSFVKHLGLRDFSFLWSWFYITLPFTGAALSVAIYFVIRGGFYGGGFGKGLVLNVFSFAALGALTGLFTDNAMEKLKQVAETLLSDTPPKVQNAKEIQDKKEAEKRNT